MSRRSGLSLFLFLALCLLPFERELGFAAQATPGQATSHVHDELIVKFRLATDESDKVTAHHRIGGKRAKVFRILRGLERIKLPPALSVKEAIDFYQRDPAVLYAEPNYILRTTVTPNDSRFGELWGLHNTGQSGGTSDADIDAAEAWNVTTGSSGVVVAVIDTGADYNHQDLSANMFRNTPDCNNNGLDDDGNGFIDDCFGIDTINDDSNPMDDHSHGTHVAGTIGAAGNNNIGVVGVNWNVRIMPCRFIDASGSGTTADAIACLEYVKEMKESGVNIIATSNSWGDANFSQALLDAIYVQLQHGILFITAAGNGNFFGIGQNNDAAPFYPCNYYLPNIICVAATTRTDARASFSNYGRRTVHIGAPGSEILSTIPGNAYQSQSGTSMATPHVTGLAALLKAQDPNRDWKAIKNLILAGGDNKSSMANTITGKRLNANWAMTCSNSVVLSRLTPFSNTISGSPGVPIALGALHINCANPNGNVNVTVSPGGQTVTLLDNGLGSDQEPDDGIYSGQWTPSAAGTFTLTFPGNDSVTVNVANPTISVSPNSHDFGTVIVGNSVDKNFTVQNSGAGVLTGTASTGAPYSIISGSSYSLAGGQSQIITVRFSPSSAGTFGGNVTFTGGDGATRPVTGVGATPANLSASPSAVAVGGTITGTWSEIAVPTTKDWIALYTPGAANTSFLAWRYTTGTASGSVPLVLPASAVPGTYELRLFANGTYTKLATSNTFTVPQPPPANLSASPTSIPAGGTLTATWSAIATPTTKDWIALSTPGAANTSYLAWRYTTGSASGSVPFVLSISLAPGSYELRLFANGTYTRLGTSNTFTVTPPPPANLSASPTSIPAGGTLTATWSAIATPTTKDWIALYTPGAVNTSYLAWRYTTGTASGSVPFVLPTSLAAGNYELRLFANGTYTRLGTSNIFTVTSP